MLIVQSSASTGGTEGSSPASSPASAASLTMAAPKYGTLVPNRVFVGGISASTSEAELAQVFSAYGNVKATKIISDRAGVSKGYGFVTFETEEEAKRLQQEVIDDVPSTNNRLYRNTGLVSLFIAPVVLPQAECIVLRERKLNIAPAIKKQPFSRSFDGSTGSPPSVPTSTYYYTNGMWLFFFFLIMNFRPLDVSHYHGLKLQVYYLNFYSPMDMLYRVEFVIWIFIL